METNYDIAVIGGGPAGLMAAGVAAQQGAKVIVLEKNGIIGKKLLLTGGSRCNLTNINFRQETLVDLFGKNGRFLFSGLSVFGVDETLKYFSDIHLKTKEEKNGCIFTYYDDAHELTDKLEAILNKNKATILKNTVVKQLIIQEKTITRIILDKQEISSKNVICCTGGRSFPMTGATGDGYTWAKAFGHTVIEPKPGLAPVYIQEPWIKNLQGIPLNNYPLTIYQNNKKQKTYHGEILCTDKGLTGPLIHNLSRYFGEITPGGAIVLSFDIMPGVNLEALDKKLNAELRNNKQLGNYLGTMISQKISECLLLITGISSEKLCNEVTKEERHKLVENIKSFRMTLDQVAGFDRAMITAGGISLKEIDSKTMKSKLINNLYFAGEIIDLDGPTGGYNLQVCWTTGYLAGYSSAHDQ